LYENADTHTHRQTALTGPLQWSAKSAVAKAIGGHTQGVTIDACASSHVHNFTFITGK